MVKFESRDPFPLLSLGSFSRTEAQSHAANVDRWLDLNIDDVELLLSKDGSRRPAPSSSGQHQQLWFGLDPRDLQTPYVEIRTLLQRYLHPSRVQRVVDLGAAYARMAFVIERHFPQAHFLGLEYVGERVLEARRCLERFGARRSHVEHADLTFPRFVLPVADIYFIYDYGTPAAIEKTLHDLKRVAMHATAGVPITIVARGRVCRYAIENRHATWLVNADPTAPECAVSVYKSMSVVVSDIASDIASDIGRIESSM